VFRERLKLEVFVDDEKEKSEVSIPWGVWNDIADFSTPLPSFLNSPALISEDEFGNLRCGLFAMIQMRGHPSARPSSPICPGIPWLQQSKKFDLSQRS
jgi:hypothetical protein